MCNADNTPTTCLNNGATIINTNDPYDFVAL